MNSRNDVAPTISGIFLILSVVTVTTVPHLDYDRKRVIELTTLLAILFISSLKKYSEYRGRGKIRSSLISLFLLGLISCLLANSPKYAAIEAITFFALIATAFQIAPSWRHAGYCKFATLSLLIIMALAETQFLSTYVAYLVSRASFSIHDFFPAFANVRFFNQFQIWTLPFVSLLLSEARHISNSKRYNNVVWPLAILWWCLFFTTESRGAFVAITAGYAFTYILIKCRDKRFYIDTVTACLIGFLFYKLLFTVIPDLLNDGASTPSVPPEMRNTTYDRIILWKRAYDIIINNPFFGAGPMHYAWSDNSTFRGAVNNNHPHNSLLQWASEWGLLSLFIVLYLLGYAAKKWFEKYSGEHINNLKLHKYKLVVAVTISIISAFVYSLVSGVIVMPTSQLTAMLPISLMIYLYNPTPSLRRTNKNYIALIILVSIAYSYLLSKDINKLLFSPDKTIEIRLTYPRFWSDGSIYHR